jgi:hypothetical protein
MPAVECLYQEYRFAFKFAFKDAYPITLAETVTRRSASVQEAGMDLDQGL